MILNLKTDLGKHITELCLNTNLIYSLPVTVRDDDVYVDYSLRVKHSEADQGRGRQKLMKLLEKYSEYKTSYAKHIKFDPRLGNLSK